MSWPQWSAAPQPSVPPVLNPTTPVINSAPSVVPPGLQYTPEQWAQLQQQNWNQWAQWQQQYQQWHQQYGAEYQKSINALAQAAQVQQTPALPNVAVPPPLPADNRPPPPVDEPPPPSYTSAPPPSHGYNTAPPLKTMRQSWGNQNYRFEQQKRNYEQPDDVNKRPMVNKPGWQQPRPSKDNLEELSEAEKKFDKQFAEWEAQFNKWKEQNAEHPDKEQYREYEKKWESWRAQLLERREQMKRKRLGLAVDSPSKSRPGSGQSFNSPQANFNQPPPKVLPSVPPKEGLLPLPQPSFNKPPPTLNDEPLKFKDSKPVPELDDSVSSFFKPNTGGGIPGLDLVKDDPKPDKSATEDVVLVDPEEKEREKKGPDFDAISKGINTILGDQKLLNMLSLVSQTQNPKISDSLTNTVSSIKEDSQNPFQEQSNQSFEDHSNHGESYAQREFVNFDDQTRSSFTMVSNDQETRFDGPGSFVEKNQNQFPNRFGNFNQGNRFGSFDEGKSNFGARPDERFPPGGPNQSRFPPNQDQNRFGLTQDKFAPNQDQFGSNVNRFGSNQDKFAPNQDQFGPNQNRFGLNQDKFTPNQDRFGPNQDKFAPNQDQFGPNQNRFGPNQDKFGPGQDRFGPNRFGPNQGRNGPNQRFGPNQNRFGPNQGKFGPNQDKFGPNQEQFGPNQQRFGPNQNRFGPNQNRFGPGPNQGKFGPNQDQFGRNESFNRNKDRNFSRGPPQKGQFNYNNDNNFNQYDNDQGYNEEEYEENYDYDQVASNFEEETSHSMDWKEEENYEDQNQPPVVEQEPPEAPKITGIFQPSEVIDYEHKPPKLGEPEVLIEPIYMFDYRHKPLSRIPIPQRPKWLADVVKNIREFDPPTVRPYEPNLRRYPPPMDHWRKDRYQENWSPHNRRSYNDDRRPYGDRYDEPPMEKRREDRRSYPEEKKQFNRMELEEEKISDTEWPDDDFEAEKPNFTKFQKPDKPTKNVVLIEDLISPPGRFKRPPRIVIILRGPPGSGKTFLAKLIKDKEVENGGSAPRILSLDDYFMVEQEKEVTEEGKKVKIKEMVYEYEAEMEESYRTSLIKSFKKTITDGYFSFIIVDNVNDKVKYFGEMWSYAKQYGFQVYICQLDLDVHTCSKRNIHGRSEADIERCVSNWEPTPQHHPILDATSLLQSASIPEVEMEEVNSPESDLNECDGSEDQVARSKWDTFDCSVDNLAKLDGVSKPLRHRTMEEYLQLDTEWTPIKPTKPGQKRVRWADLEEQKQQEKMRAIGFVVGHTDWDRMMDPTGGSSALTQTKYIERTGRFKVDQK
nr:PREDICTED: YLP motif-containing protein 1 isoform X1 [Tribolium castaneum]|eukprot:XP_015834690.1 PREDICTED: YLP motif-containing protein 1 isoform X1 [Tribolium castaneum]